MRNFSWKERIKDSLFCVFGIVLAFALAVLLPDYVFFLKCLMLMLSIAFFIIFVVLIVGSIVEQISNNLHNRQVMFSAENVEKWAVVEKENVHQDSVCNAEIEPEETEHSTVGLDIDQRIQEEQPGLINVNYQQKTALDEHYMQLLQSVRLQEKRCQAMPTAYKGNNHNTRKD